MNLSKPPSTIPTKKKSPKWLSGVMRFVADVQHSDDLRVKGLQKREGLQSNGHVINYLLNKLEEYEGVIIPGFDSSIHSVQMGVTDKMP